MGKPINLTQAQAEQVLSEVFDKTKVVLLCGKHFYVGSNLPPKPIGCQDCWKAYYWYMIATTPPDLREERINAALHTVRRAVSDYEHGKFDFEPLDRPIIETEKQ